MADLVCLSDLHFGDIGCVLNDTGRANHLADQIALRSGGSIGTLVLNGDVWEQCIPIADGGAREMGFFPMVAQSSRHFFGRLLASARIGKIVVLFGNHDLTLWHRLAASLGSETLYTAPDGVSVRPGQTPAITEFFSALWPDRVMPEMRVAYPCYASAASFPYVLFHHGHLLDSFVLGWENDWKDRVLHLAGSAPPTVAREGSSMRALADATQAFILQLWREDSDIDRLYWNAINRRLDHPQSCPLAGSADQIIPSEAHPTSPRDGCLPNVTWFLNLAINDSELPSPVKGVARARKQPDDFNKRSCFVFGHDHLGSRATLVVAGVPFALRDSAGWTREYEGHGPHTHFLVWDQPGSCVPSSCFVNLA